MVSCQMLSELEEVIQYKLVPERRDIIRETWWERLQVTKAYGHTHPHANSRVLYRFKTDVGEATVTNGKHYKPDTIHTCKGTHYYPSE